jgi:hypothetical protein
MRACATALSAAQNLFEIWKEKLEPRLQLYFWLLCRVELSNTMNNGHDAANAKCWLDSPVKRMVNALHAARNSHMKRRTCLWSRKPLL